MSALDKLLAQALAETVKQKLGTKTYQRVEARLSDRYGLNVVDAIRDFQKLDATLREFFGPGADKMEKDFLEHLASLDTSKRDKPWVIIENEELARVILESLAHREKKLILDTSLKQPDVILNILDKCNIPKSTGYRLVTELINDGLLAEKGFTTTHDGKKVSIYTSLFENVKIDMEQEKTVVKVQLKEDVLKESYLVKIMLEQ